MQKRGQVAIFFMIGLIILIAAFMLSFSKEPFQEQVTDDVGISFNSYVESCLQQVGEEAVYETSLQGGHYFPPLDGIEFFSVIVPIYWKDKLFDMPSEDEIESSLRLYVEDNLDSCLGNFDIFRDFGKEVVPESAVAMVDIRASDVLFEINYPITVVSGDSQQQFEEFGASVELNLRHTLDTVREFSSYQKSMPEHIPLSDLLYLEEKNLFRSEVIEHNDSVMIYGFIFPQENKDPIIFSFAGQYDWSFDE